VILDVFRAELQVSISLRKIMVGQVSDDALGLSVKASGKFDVLCEDHFEDLIWVFVHEWASAHHHLIDEDAKCIPVNWFTMAFVEDNLWCQVFRGSTESVGSFTRLELLHEAKV